MDSLKAKIIFSTLCSIIIMCIFYFDIAILISSGIIITLNIIISIIVYFISKGDKNDSEN